eukprot:m.26418 g.26418  ORF g.26418 m.26418 type:complete len:140 (-) comp10041_c1_seq1:1445-1864(-)
MAVYDAFEHNWQTGSVRLFRLCLCCLITFSFSFLFASPCFAFVFSFHAVFNACLLSGNTHSQTGNFKTSALGFCRKSQRFVLVCVYVFIRAGKMLSCTFYMHIAINIVVKGDRFVSSAGEWQSHFESVSPSKNDILYLF